MPMERIRYPTDWREIATAVKTEASWKCEQCGRQCRKPGEPFTTHRNTLTVAHLDHTPENCARENLRAMCAPCHLRYDAQHHAETRRRKREGRPMENGEYQARDIEAGVWVDITEPLTYAGRTDGENETAYSYQGRARRAGSEDAALFQITVFLAEPVDADMSDDGVYLPILTKIGILRRRAEA